MIDGLAVYKIWAPSDCHWAKWIKPILFASRPENHSIQFDIDSSWLNEVRRDTMVIVDLPDIKGVMEGIRLAEVGYRPIPLYNGVKGPANSEAVMIDVRKIQCALFSAVRILKKLSLDKNAPPVFLLDSRRLDGGNKYSGVYDNRWCLFPQDMPSASYLEDQKITKIIVRTNKMNNDLAAILERYAKAKISILLAESDKDSNGIFKDISNIKPSKTISFFYRFKTILGLKRNAAGGFGGFVPDSHSGGRYYYIG